MRFLPSRYRSLVLACVFALAGGLNSCAGKQQEPELKNPLTHGNVQLQLKVGVTTQTQVLEVFGAPNIASIEGSGREVWTYRRVASVSKSKSSGGFFFLLLGGYSGSRGSSSSSQRSTTLIIKFDESKIVSDFKSRTSTF